MGDTIGQYGILLHTLKVRSSLKADRQIPVRSRQQCGLGFSRKIVIPKFSSGGSHAAAERAWEPALLGQFKFWNSPKRSWGSLGNKLPNERFPLELLLAHTLGSLQADTFFFHQPQQLPWLR